MSDQRPPNPNRVRDHLANERTYLAWLRTAIALMGFGVIIVRLRYFLPPEAQARTHGWEIGLLFAGVGLLSLLISTIEYFTIRRAIDEGNYEPVAWWIALLSITVGVLGLGVLYYLMTVPVSLAPIPFP